MVEGLAVVRRTWNFSFILFGNNCLLVIEAAGVHPVPSRTRKLSLPALMILGR
jgi:hypothetical protein